MAPRQVHLPRTTSDGSADNNDNNNDDSNNNIINNLNALRAYTATVPMTQYDVPEVSRRFRPHLPLHFAIQISEK